ncbi:hypothetical protein FKM82_028617 [Ascaphus truei]
MTRSAPLWQGKGSRRLTALLHGPAPTFRRGGGGGMGRFRKTVLIRYDVTAENVPSCSARRVLFYSCLNYFNYYYLGLA